MSEQLPAFRVMQIILIHIDVCYDSAVALFPQIVDPFFYDPFFLSNIGSRFSKRIAMEYF